ncbi:hypothetical protein MUO14_02500 [Halobacillus shinanisalinarum]|uniref:SPOR domain-containing protein n=1 Tax=Halobacillus shinanisalinarum TaxID=2932258 RepID=A0ABY4H0L9_9BACI|nr:hypothetical protein [Halobacillus shinanisalinarum]UOQ93879.1 hypothetical protein MUO14_02500 [Halobacillus shinanisalinarum]
MSQKNKISISLRKREEPVKQEILQAKREQAAAADVKESPEYRGDSSHMHVHEMPYKGKKINGPPFMKNIMLSVITALIISLALGFLLLRMFVSVTGDNTSSPNEPANAGASAVPSDPVSMVTVEYPSFEATIVQVGVYSTESKANEWKENLADQSVPSVVWERDSQFYLMAGSNHDQAAIELLAAELSASDIPTYTKSWSVAGGSAEVSEAQSSIVETIVQHMESQSLASVPLEERKQLMQAWQETEHANGDFLNALKTWSNEGENGISWLMFGNALEKMKNS